MKTIRYTTALLITLALGFYTVQAQSARRSDHREKREVTATKENKREAVPQKARTARSSAQVQKKEVQRKQATQPTRNVQRTEVQRQRATRSTPNVQRTETQRQRTMQPAPNVQRKRTAGDAQKRTSISTPNNPRSTYRKADSKVYVDRNRTANTRVNKYSSKNYYGGHHYHYVYPKVRVNTHHHQDTYIHHYRVLYRPTYVNIYWTRNMYRDYRTWYPNYHWRYDYGYRIQTISIFDAKYNLGEVAAVYGRVYATWYNRETDDYLLFFGGDYPYQEFTVVLPAHVAKRFSWRPERYFLGEHIIVNGLITTFDGIPEIVVKHRRQVELY